MLTNNAPPGGESQVEGLPDGMTVHPAAAEFPMMPDPELDALGADIRKHGLKHGLVLYKDVPSDVPGRKRKESLPDYYKRAGIKRYLVDGRNRLAAVARENAKTPGRTAEDVGVDDCLPLVQDLFEGDYEFCPAAIWLNELPDHPDPVDYVISANVHRRHLTRDKKREVVEALLKARPERSDRETAKIAKVSPTTVGDVRAKLEEAGEVSKLDTRTGADGVSQPAHKPPGASTPEPEPEPEAPAPEPTAALPVAPEEALEPVTPAVPDPKVSPQIVEAVAAANKLSDDEFAPFLGAMIDIAGIRDLLLQQLIINERQAPVKIPKPKRIELALDYIAALDLGLDDLRPIGAA